MNYEVYLFDADDTLFDFQKSQEASFFKVISPYCQTDQIKSILKTYQHENHRLWNLFEQGKISKESLTTERFQVTSDIHNLNLPAKEINQQYLDQLPLQAHLNDNSYSVCKELSQKARIGIITNGISQVQKKRLERSPLLPLIEFMIVSEDCEFPKPHPHFFETTMKKLRSIPKEKILVVGDRLETDIKGANNFGIDSCWFNPTAQKNETSISPKYEIRSLQELTNGSFHG